MAKFPRLAVVTIQGGGAFGFGLLGQLQAVLDHGIIPIAFAGTSAGAIIATLHWAGYEPSQIRDKLSALADDKQLTQLTGPFKEGNEGDQEFSFNDFVALKKEIEQRLQQSGATTTVGTHFGSLKRSWNTLQLCLLTWKAFARISPRLPKRGLFRGDTLTDTLDRWLREAPNLSESAREALQTRRPRSEKVTFGDFAAVAGSRPLPPLFLPVTNVTKRRLELVCSIDKDYAGWSIARGVRASAGFPGFFQPVSLGQSGEESYYVDGGIIANYPAWVFGHQFRKKLYEIDAGREFAIRPWLHIGLCFGPPNQVSTDPERGATLASFSKGLVHLLRGGARQELEQEIAKLIARLIEIRQPEDETGAPESLLDFAECTRERIEVMFKKGRSAANVTLDRYRFDYPPSDEVLPLMQELINKALVCFGQLEPDGKPDNSVLQLRANVFLPAGDETELWRVNYSVNMTGDPDERFALPKFAGLTGMCVGLRRPLICNLEEVGRAAQSGRLDKDKLFGMTEELHRDVRPDRTWLASVPIFDHYASYPTRIGGELRRFEGRHHSEIAFRSDGAVIGVLNLDAALPYERFGLRPNPEEHSTSPVIRAIIDVMRSVAFDLGCIFSRAFGAAKETGDAVS